MPLSQTERHSYHHGDLRAAILRRAAEIIEASGIEALSLRGIARDLGVSHGAPNRHFRSKQELLSALAAEAWNSACGATLAAAESEDGGDPHRVLNAMGRGFLRWALANRPLLVAILHPDVSRASDPSLDAAFADYQATIRKAVEATQADGRHPEVDPAILNLYTNSVPFGIAALLLHRNSWGELMERDPETVITELIELVVPTR